MEKIKGRQFNTFVIDSTWLKEIKNTVKQMKLILNLEIENEPKKSEIIQRKQTRSSVDSETG